MQLKDLKIKDHCGLFLEKREKDDPDQSIGKTTSTPPHQILWEEFSLLLTQIGMIDHVVL